MLRRSWLQPALVFGVALVVRVGFAWVGGGHDLVARFGGNDTDPKTYDWTAQNILQYGSIGTRGQPTARRGPAYPVFLAAVYSVVGRDFLRVRLIQSVLDASVAVIVCATLTLLGHRRAGLWSGWVYALYPIYVFNASEIMTEGLALWFTAILVYALMRAGARRSRWAALAAGLAAAGLALTRENTIILIPLLAAIAAFSGAANWRRPRLTACGWFTTGFLALYAPYVIRNAVHFHTLMLTGTSGGVNLLRGIAGAIEGDDFDWPRTMSEYGILNYWQYYDPAYAGHSFPNEVENDRQVKAKARELIRTHPGVFVRSGVKHVVAVLLQWEDTEARSAVGLRTAVAWSYRLAAVLGLAGMGIAWRAGLRAFVVTHGAIIATALVVIFMVPPWKRYRYVAFDFACVSAAGFALSALWQQIRNLRIHPRRTSAAGRPALQ